MDNHKVIGSNIKALRKQMGLTQESLAKYLAVHREVISYYEIGSREVPVEDLLKLSDLFGCELSDLIDSNPDALNTSLAFAFRASELQEQDLESIAEFKKVVKNYLKLINIQSGTN